MTHTYHLTVSVVPARLVLVPCLGSLTRLPLRSQLGWGSHVKLKQGKTCSYGRQGPAVPAGV